MATSPMKASPRVSVPVRLDELAESIWRLPRRERETLEDLLERRFVRTVLRRAKDIPKLRKAGALLTLADLRKQFPRR